MLSTYCVRSWRASSDVFAIAKFLFVLHFRAVCDAVQYTPGKFEVSRRENRCILKIKNAAKDDGAEYSCEVEGDKTSSKVTIEGELQLNWILASSTTGDRRVLIFHPISSILYLEELSYRRQIARQLRTQYDEGIYRPKYYTLTLKCRLRVTQGH